MALSQEGLWFKGNLSQNLAYILIYFHHASIKEDFVEGSPIRSLLQQTTTNS